MNLRTSRSQTRLPDIPVALSALHSRWHQINAHIRRGLNSCGPPVTLRSAKHGRETWLG